MQCRRCSVVSTQFARAHASPHTSSTSRFDSAMAVDDADGVSSGTYSNAAEDADADADKDRVDDAAAAAATS